jgi:hypothetical protein
MRHLIIRTIAASGLLLAGGLAANAQYQPRTVQYQYQDREQRDDRYNDRLFDRVRGDLERAHASTLPFSADRSRVTEAEQLVNACERRVNSGDFDRRDFYQAINAMQRVADMNRLSDRNRDDILGDARELREMQGRLLGY